MRLKRVLIPVAVIGVLALLPLAVERGLNSAAGQRLIVQAVHKGIGRTLVIHGPIHLAWGRTLQVSTGALSLSNRGATTQLASVQAVWIGLRPLALLGGHVEITQLHLEHPQVNLTRDAAGHTNIDDLLKPHSPHSPVHLALRDVQIQAGTVQITDARSHLNARFDPIHIALAASKNGPIGQLALTGQGSVDGKPAQLHLTAVFQPDPDGQGMHLQTGQLSATWPLADQQVATVTMQANGALRHSDQGLTGQLTARTEIQAGHQGHANVQLAAQLQPAALSVQIKGHTDAPALGQVDESVAATLVPAGNDQFQIKTAQAQIAGQLKAAGPVQVRLEMAGLVGRREGVWRLPAGQMTFTATPKATPVQGAIRTTAMVWDADGVQLGAIHADLHTADKTLHLVLPGDEKPASWQQPRPLQLTLTAAQLVAQLKGTWALPGAQQLQLQQLQGNLRWQGPALVWQGSALINAGQHRAQLQGAGQLAGSPFSATAHLEQHPLKVTADLQFDRLDLDALLQHLKSGSSHPKDTAPHCDFLAGRLQAKTLVYKGWTAKNADLKLSPALCQ